MALTLHGIENQHVLPTADLDPIKMRHRHSYNLSQPTGTAVVAAVQHLFLARGTGTLKSFEATITGIIATGADRTVTVDLLKSTGLAAFASVLSAALVFNNVSTLRVISAAAISNAGIVDGDILQMTVVVAGAAGNQAQGLVATLEAEAAA